MSKTGPDTSWRPSARQLDRDRYRRRRTARSGVIALASSVVVIVAVVIGVRSSSGWPATRDSFFDFSAGWTDFPALLAAFWVNVQIMLIAEVCVLVLGALVAAARTLRGPVFFPLRALAVIYVDVFRGLPLLIVLYLVGFGLPSLRIAQIPDSPFVLGIVALVLSYTAYVAEVFRAGIESIHPSQTAAARSLGLTHGQSLRFVVFPQAVRRVLPPLLNDFVSLQKDTSLVSVVAVSEIVLVAQGQVSQDFKFVHYLMAGLVFVLISVPLTRLTDWIARRQGWVGSAAAAIR